MDKSKKSRYICLAAVNGASLIIFAVLAAIFCNLTGMLSSQLAADRWNSSGEGRYSQLSAFYSKDAGTDINAIYTMRVDIEKKFKENSLLSENENARLWFDAYSAQETMSVVSSRSDYTITAEAVVTATGGDYFMFHPLKLLSGAYYSDNDLMDDRVILDESLAWQLFGSNDVSGMTVLIGGKRFYVAGVVEPDNDKDSKHTYGEKPHMYMSYDGMKTLYEENVPPIMAYEACMPNPVTGLAKSILTEVISASDENVSIVENSARFSLKNLFNIAFDGGKRSVINSAVIYPYWENAARIVEDKAAGVLTAATFALVIPILTVLYFVGFVIHKRKELFKKLAEKIHTILYNIKRNKKSI